MTSTDQTIWWHVYPLSAAGAPIRGGDRTLAHRLPRLENWLGYVADLGCTGVLLGPVFDSAGHGYDTLDHFRIDPRLGDDADFDHFVAACHDKGLAVMLDGVFNHVAPGHALAEGGLAGPRDWEGHPGLLELHHKNPAVADYVASVMLHWLRRGIAGWRLDVAYAVPSWFWRDVLGKVRSEFPDAVFLGEVIHGDYAAIADAGTLTTVTQYELWKAIWSSLVDRNFWELSSALERHASFSRRHVMQTFAGNHDVSRIASIAGEDGAALAAVILFTVPGMPSVYYGDEQAFRGTRGKGEAADDAVRPPLPTTPAELVPYGSWMHRLYADLIALRRRNPWITSGTVRVLAKDNTWIEYKTTGEGHTLRVRLDLAGQPSARVEVDGMECFAWRGNATPTSPIKDSYTAIKDG